VVFEGRDYENPHFIEGLLQIVGWVVVVERFLVVALGVILALLSPTFFDEYS
jgi:hypothetical protein